MSAADQEAVEIRRPTEPVEPVCLEPGQPDCQAVRLPGCEPGRAASRPGSMRAEEAAGQSGSPAVWQRTSGHAPRSLELPGSPAPWQPGSEGNRDRRALRQWPPGIRFYVGVPDTVKVMDVHGAHRKAA